MTGATGFLGIHVLKAFLDSYEGTVYALVRKAAEVLYCLGYKWPITDDNHLENAINALDKLGFYGWEMRDGTRICSGYR